MMEVTIQCPHCQMELEAPAELEGKPAICPGCQAQFIVKAIDSTPEPDAAPEVPTSPSPENEPPPRSSKRKSKREQPSKNLAESTGSSPASPRFKGLDSDLLAELQGDAPSDRSQASGAATDQEALRAPKIPQPATRNVQPQKRKRKTAKLLTGESAEAWLPLGADGQLPQLIVKDQQQKESQKRDHKDSNPLVLVAVLVGSVAMSLLLLFVPDEGLAPQGNTPDSLVALEKNYIGKKYPLEPYQVLVRDALEHEHEGERAEAKAIYRRLLDMLHAEKRNPNEFLTGPPFSSQEPNDRSFEYHLKILLSSR